MVLGLLILSGCLLPSLTLAASGPFSTSSFAVPGAFPTSIYSKYYNSPTATSAQVQPIISDPVTHETYPLELTDPDHLSTLDKKDPHPLPPTASSSKLLEAAITQIKSIANSTVFNGSCAKCLAGLEVAKFLALAAPEQGPTFAVQVCELFDFANPCNATYGEDVLGSVVTQIFANNDAAGLDGEMFCWNFLGLCPRPPVSPLDLTGWFAKPKPDPLPKPKTPSGQRLKVLHLSDFHLDPRYSTGSEAACSSGLCCRTNEFNKTSPNTPVFPAPRFGSYLCDSPYALGLAAVEAIPVLTDTKEAGFDFMIFTGDLVSHDPADELSRDYVKYTEVVLYDLFKRTLLSGPVYATLGNHDSYNQAQGSPNSLDDPGPNQYSWNYDHVAALWEHEGWLEESITRDAKTHYAAYSVQRSDGLRVISLNTNLWYTANYFNYINMTNPDVSGMLRMLTDELQAAEDAGERAWIIGHVLSGWDGTNPLQNPTNLFYQIVDRYSPHVIANIFWGHTHEDQFTIFYANNGTNMTAETALAQAWIAPSITPLTNLNSGFRVYEVDSSTFDIMDAYTWKSNVNSFPDLDHQLEYGPTYEFEYSTRETYGQNITGWTDSDPLNATWWHKVTEAMDADNSLVTTFTEFQGKESIKTPVCTPDCINARICYMRSGSVPIALQNCQPGFGSVQ